MERKQRVEGHDSLLKDSRTNVIINNNREAFLAAKLAKQRAKAMIELEDRVKVLEAKLDLLLGK